MRHRELKGRSLREKKMGDWPPVIDADGHVLERPPWNRRGTSLWPSDQPFDTELFDTLGYPGYERSMSPAQQVEMWLKIMDEYNIEEAVLFPTGSGNIPNLRLAFLEIGATWLPYWLDRMDEHWELRGEFEAPHLKKKPSEVVRESRIYFSLEAEERLLPQTIEYLGDGHFLYASDIPHWDGEFPKNLEYLWNHPDLSRETKEKIAYHNGRTYFQLKRPASAQAARKAK
jgi:hypothetical protein